MTNLAAPSVLRLNGADPGFDLKAALLAEAGAAAQAAMEPDLAVRVHRMRVRLKRVRALARLAQVAAPEAAQAINRQARSFMAALSQTRDLAALEAIARETVAHAPGQGAALGRIAADLGAERTALEAQKRPAVGRRLARLEKLCLALPPLTAEDLRRGALRLDRRAEKAWRRARKSHEVEDRHDWRKREKDRLYAVELLGEAWPKEVKRRRRAAKRLAQALGAERDMLMLLERLQGGEDYAEVREALGRRCARLARRADKLGAALHR